MGFLVTTLLLDEFRIHEHREIGLAPGLTILVGPNAIGKTAIVEALQLLTTGSSFRRPIARDLVRRGADSSRIQLHARDGERFLEMELLVTKDGEKTFAANGKKVRSRAGVAGRLPSVVFGPEDLVLIKGSAEGRRAALDALGEQLSRTYGSLRREYEKALRQRNALLKEKGTLAHADVWDEPLADLGARLAVHRTRLLRRVEERAEVVYGTISSGEKLSLEYEMGWCRQPGVEAERDELRESLLAELARRRAEERDRGVTLSGPHRDDVLVRIDHEDARAFASQGQQRSIVLAWKIAEVSVIEDVLGIRPLLLLDDVMSELDEKRRSMLADLVHSDTQTVITTTNLQYFSPELLDVARVVSLP